MKNKPIIITGMHRSGTTLLSKLFDYNKVFMGQYKESNNESKFFLKINNWLLSSIGASWDNPSSFYNLSLEEKDILLKGIESLLKSRSNALFFGLTSAMFRKNFYNIDKNWGWKDPRNTLSLSLWMTIFPSARIINIQRNPLHVAVSMYNRQLVYKKNDQYKKNKLYSSIAKLLNISHSGITSSLLIKNLDDCLNIIKIYYEQAKLNSERYNIKNIKYENLLMNPETVSKDVLNYCEIDYENSNLKLFLNNIKSANIYKYKNINLQYDQKLLDDLNELIL